MTRTLDPVVKEEQHAGFRRFRLFLVGGVVLLVLLGAVLAPQSFFPAYLFASLACLNVSLGCLLLVFIHRMTGGAWGQVLAPALEAGGRMVPWSLLFCVPWFFGLRHLFPWAAPEMLDDHARALLAKHVSYFGTGAFVARALAYVGSCFLLLALARHGAEKAWTGPVGMMLYVVTVYLLGVDWILSLEPGWYSTAFPVILMAGQALAALAYGIAMTILTGVPGAAERQRPAVWKDLGNLLLGAVMFWAYVAYAQFLIVWAGNLPAQAAPYLHRNAGGWHYLLVLIAVFQLLVPVLLLLPNWTKRRTGFFAVLAWSVVLGQAVYLYWTILPSFRPAGIGFHPLDAVLPLALDVLWLVLLPSLKTTPKGGWHPCLGSCWQFPPCSSRWCGPPFFPPKTAPRPVATPPVPDPDAPSAESQEVGHEVTDANARTMLIFVTGLFAVIIGTMVALGFMYIHLYAKDPVLPAKQASFKHSQIAKTSIATDWRTIDELAHQRLDGFGWTDRKAGVVHVPISRAMELVAREGLPARITQTPSFPPPNQEKLPLPVLETNANANSFDPQP